MKPVRVGICTSADVFEQRKFAATLSSLDILLLPELLDGGYAALRKSKPPHTFNDSFFTVFRSASRRFSNCIIAGSTFLRLNTSQPTNTSLTFTRGKLVHRYDKIHLFKPAGDALFFTRGALTPCTFTVNMVGQVIRAGVVLCYDLRFPELARAMALQGMAVLFVPARWPQSRDDAWQSLLKARAIENQIFVVGCNAADKEGGYSYGFNPAGRMIFSNRKKKKNPLHVLEIDLREIFSAQQLHRNLDDAVFLKTLL